MEFNVIILLNGSRYKQLVKEQTGEGEGTMAM
jgi:hypothetical protein